MCRGSPHAISHLCCLLPPLNHGEGHRGRTPLLPLQSPGRPILVLLVLLLTCFLQQTEGQARAGRGGPECARPSPALSGPHFQHAGQGVQLLLLILRAVRVAEVQQALVVLLQELVELGVFVLQPRKLVLVLRRTAFPSAGKVGQSSSQTDRQSPGWGWGGIRLPAPHTAGLLASSGKTGT